MGDEPNIHALAEKVGHLHEDINQMREEDRQWREELRKIFVELAKNREVIVSLSNRITLMEVQDRDRDAKIELLNAWRWKSAGVIGAIIFALEWWFKS